MAPRRGTPWAILAAARLVVSGGPDAAHLPPFNHKGGLAIPVGE